jgi:hypothetical protein
MLSTYQQNSSIELELMGEETILLNTTTNKFCLLNRSAAVIWNALKQPSTLDSVVSVVCETFQGVAQLDASKDAQNVLEQLQANGFVINAANHLEEIDIGNPNRQSVESHSGLN